MEPAAIGDSSVNALVLRNSYNANPSRSTTPDLRHTRETSSIWTYAPSLPPVSPRSSVHDLPMHTLNSTRGNLTLTENISIPNIPHLRTRVSRLRVSMYDARPTSRISGRLPPLLVDQGSGTHNRRYGYNMQPEPGRISVISIRVPENDIIPSGVHPDPSMGFVFPDNCPVAHRDDATPPHRRVENPLCRGCITDSLRLADIYPVSSEFIRKQRYAGALQMCVSIMNHRVSLNQWFTLVKGYTLI
jgi:hypothetical protein